MNSTQNTNHHNLLLELVIVLISAVLIPGCQFEAESIKLRIDKEQNQLDATSMLKGDVNEN